MPTLPSISLNNPQAAPATLTLGTAAWKAFDFFANVDFLLSIESKTFLIMFDFFANYGWWIILIAGSVWWYSSTKYAPAPRIEPVTVAIIGLVAFLWGVIVTVHATGKIPKVIEAYGSGMPGTCYAEVRMDRLESFRDDFNLALICGIKDPSVDKLKDPKISVSEPRVIVPGKAEILMRVSDDMLYKAQGMMAQKYVPSVWHEAVLLPKTVYLPSIKSLADVVVQGGKIIDPAYFDYKPPK
jgi:hypothetical protein